MNITRTLHPFEIVSIKDNKVAVNEGFVYKADTLERTSVKDIVQGDGDNYIKSLWKIALPKGYGYEIPEREDITFVVEIEHEDPADTSFLKSCDIKSAKIILSSSKQIGTPGFSYIEIAKVNYDPKSGKTSITQYLNSDIFVFIWGEKDTV
jgi:hypothetical protein